MNKKTKFIAAVCLLAQSFTSIVLSFVYANRKKELSKAFLGLGVLGGLGGAYLLYKEYEEIREEKLACEGEWCEDEDCDCCDDIDFDELDADDINFTIAEEEQHNDDDESAKTAENAETTEE